MIKVYSLTRVEPVSRGGDPGRGLAATVQDPFWMLARQRQFGELTGEDAGSPVQVAFVEQQVALDGWKTLDGEAQAYSPRSDVLEALVAGEAAGPAHSSLDRLEAGRALASAVPKIVYSRLRRKFPLSLADDAPRILLRAASVFADGLAVASTILAATGASDAELADALGISLSQAKKTRKDLEGFGKWASVTFGTGPDSWFAERLERRFELMAGDNPVLKAAAHNRERVDWHDFDSAADPDWTAGSSKAHRRVPTIIEFPGQPRNRFWEFEDATLALARIDAATTDLGRLALVEFSTIYGNDWFSFPIPVTYGSLVSLKDLVVRDTFGTHELISPAADASWTMYRPTGSSVTDAVLALPSVTAAPLAGTVVEQVRFLRDEMANLVWGVEQIVTDADGRLRNVTDEYMREPVESEPPQSNAAVAYRLITDVPNHWVPFIPVQLNEDKRQVGLVEALLPRPGSMGDVEIPEPRSSILQELKGQVLAEEEVPSAGIVVRRRWFLARSADGGRHAWAARSVTTGRGEGASGLRFDVAESVE